MFHHVAVFRFREGTSDAAIEALRAALDGLPDEIPGIARYRVGPALGLVEGSWDFAVVAEFADEAGWRSYAQHPAHLAVSDTYVKPIVAEMARVQFQT